MLSKLLLCFNYDRGRFGTSKMPPVAWATAVCSTAVVVDSLLLLLPLFVGVLCLVLVVLCSA